MFSLRGSAAVMSFITQARNTSKWILREIDDGERLAMSIEANGTEGLMALTAIRRQVGR